jgi:hypothetical protein
MKKITRISVRFTEEEKATLERRAVKMGFLSVSEFIRCLTTSANVRREIIPTLLRKSPKIATD